jgi:hypothetical protein
MEQIRHTAKRTAVFLTRQDLYLLTSYLAEYIADDMKVGVRPNKRLMRILDKFERARQRAMERAL